MLTKKFKAVESAFLAVTKRFAKAKDLTYRQQLIQQARRLIEEADELIEQQFAQLATINAKFDAMKSSEVFDERRPPVQREKRRPRRTKSQQVKKTRKRAKGKNLPQITFRPAIRE